MIRSQALLSHSVICGDPVAGGGEFRDRLAESADLSTAVHFIPDENALFSNSVTIKTLGALVAQRLMHGAGMSPGATHSEGALPSGQRKRLSQ
jgi:hypothetical protein